MTSLPTPTRAAPEDEAALIRLIEAAYKPYLDQGLSLPDMASGLDAEIAAGRVWVTRTESGPSGLLNLSVAPPDAHLINVAVDASMRGTGLGGALIRFAVETARQAGCTRLCLATHPAMAGNLAMYQHLGWQVISASASKTSMELVL